MVVVFFSSRRRHTRCALVTGVQTCARPICNGSSALRPGRDHDWGYRELLTADLPASEQAIDSLLPALPRVIGGHSLGGQLACCRLALDPHAASVLWLVASGAPYWRAFPPRTRWWLPLVYRFLPWLADACGALPGRRIGLDRKSTRLNSSH